MSVEHTPKITRIVLGQNYHLDFVGKRLLCKFLTSHGMHKKQWLGFLKDFIMDFFSKSEQDRSFLRICSHYGYNESLFLQTSYVVLDNTLSRLFYVFEIDSCITLMDVLVDVL